MLGAMRAHRRLRAVAALAVVAALTLSACGGNDNKNSGSTQQKSAAKPVPRSPITGLPLTSTPKHPIMGVKIDNSANSAPQVGLSAADMVVEELVEGGITRLAAFFLTHVPPNVGPVRSMRATDIGVVKPLHGVLVASGGAPVTVKRVHDAGITTYTEGAKGFYRDSNRAAPYNLFNHLPELAGSLKPPSKALESYLPFSSSGLPKGRPASGLTARFSGGSSTSFRYQGGKYVNTDSNAASGDAFTPDTVLVLRVNVGDAGYRDPAGNPVPETKFTGKGHAMIFHGGRMVQGTWTKAGYDAPVRLDQRGKQLALPPGKVWIELVPAAGGFTQAGSVLVTH